MYTPVKSISNDCYTSGYGAFFQYILRKLAMLYYEAEELKKAAQCFKEAIAVNSSDWQLYDKVCD